MSREMLREARLLRDALRVAVPVEEEGKVLARRQQLLSVLEHEIASTPERLTKARTRVLLRSGLIALSAAATLLGALGLGMLISRGDQSSLPGSVTLQSKSPMIELSSDSKRPSGSDIAGLRHPTLTGKTFQTDTGQEERVRMAGETELALASSTQLSILEDSEARQELVVTRGEVSVSVPEKRTPRSVRVRTAHATVSVTGTLFSVGVGQYDQPTGTLPRTRVTVTRGQVLVRYTGGEVILNRGDTWVSPLEGTTTAHSGRQARRLPHPTAHSEEASTLAAQNRLLEQALAAEERGDSDRAKALIHEFLSRYPSSPLRGAAVTIKKRLP
jgi:hypothetical protein